MIWFLLIWVLPFALIGCWLVFVRGWREYHDERGWPYWKRPDR